MKENMNAAKTLIDNLKRREDTVCKVANYILDFQRDALAEAKHDIKSLTIKDVAKAVNFHPSTISRAVSNKYVQVNDKLLPLNSLLSHGIRKENSDTTYTKYLIEYLRHENHADAIHRSMQTCEALAEEAGIQPHDILRYGNVNRVCYAITLGKISPWMLFQSDSGVTFLDNLGPDHVKLIIDYINPEQWALKFKREPENASDIKDLLKSSGY